jgi:large subunit ribosomal protein L33
MGERSRVSLACSECEARNYRTTRKADQKGQGARSPQGTGTTRLCLKKYCPACKRHTVHKETK